MTTSPPVPPKKSALRLVLVIVGLVAALAGLVGLVYGGRMLFGSDVGESCSDDNSCKPGSKCISKICYRGCKTDADCKDGWSCGSTEVSVTPGGNAAKGFKFESVNICFSPEKMAPVREKQRQAALAEKKQDVSRRVIVLLVTKPPQLTPAEFDGAWAKIAEDERSSKTVDELAVRVIEIARPKQ